MTRCINNLLFLGSLSIRLARDLKKKKKKKKTHWLAIIPFTLKKRGSFFLLKAIRWENMANFFKEK